MLVKGLQPHSGSVRYSQLAQLAPPYAKMEIWVPARAEWAPLGTIVYSSGSSALAVVGSVAIALRSCPWLIPVITLPSPEERFEPLVQIVGELQGRVAIAHQTLSTETTLVAMVDAVRRRGPPRPETMSHYCASRSSAPELLEPLTEQFAQALGTSSVRSRSVATYSRLFAHHGPYTAHDWRSLARLAHDLCALPPRLGPSPDGLTWRTTDSNATIRNRTANRHARRFLAMSFAAAGQRLGWECVLEYALRRGGYVSSSDSSTASTRKT